MREPDGVNVIRINAFNVGVIKGYFQNPELVITSEPSLLQLIRKKAIRQSSESLRLVVRLPAVGEVSGEILLRLDSCSGR
jgi:hypothetical protein